MPWGIPVPGDPEQVMYVWFDALINYISTLGWPKDLKNFKDFWPGVQVAGKDNLRQQTAIWQAMLASAGLPFSKQVFIHGFITINGQKISKSLGNTVNPIEFAEKYGTDALRYYLLSKINPYDDSDFSTEKFEKTYNGELANGLGNLVARTAKLCENSDFEFHSNDMYQYRESIDKQLKTYRFDEALKTIWLEVTQTDQFINEEEPWTLKSEGLKKVLVHLVDHIRSIAFNLKPFLPETAEKIEKQFKGPKIKSAAPLFPRLG
jgi:methionyl-tRNA synthetase